MLKFAAVPLALFAAYAASPYVTLYELGQDMRSGNAAALCAAIDWARVRSGLKQDLADSITGEPAATPAVATGTPRAGAADDDLPPFGSGFVTNLAGNVIDRTVTPRHLAETLQEFTAASAAAPSPDIAEARFLSPTRFTVAFHPTGEKAELGMVRLRLDLVRQGARLRWMVTHADIPPAMLEKTDTHTS